MGFSHAYWMVLGCATLVGIGNNLWHPTAIPWLANRFPQRKGLVTSIHGMGGNVGDAVAPLVIGALLGVLNWRSVVVLNVLPGIALSAFTLIYIGRKQSADRDAGLADVHAVAMSAIERLRMFGALLKNRALITLAVQLTPTTPMPLFPIAPTVPEVWVPWPLSSRGSQVSRIALYPWLPAGQSSVRLPIITS